MKRLLAALGVMLAGTCAHAALVDLAKEGTNTVGTGTLTVTGAVTGYLSIEQAASQLGVAVDGQSVSYGIVDGNSRESGRGTYNATLNTLTRCDSDCASTNGGSPINLSGSATVAIVAIHQDFSDLTNPTLSGDVDGLAQSNDLDETAVESELEGVLDVADLQGFSAVLTEIEAAAAYQPLDADLTSWAAITRAAGFDAFVATPSSANLGTLVTDETGSGALVFGTAPDITISANTESNIETAVDTLANLTSVQGLAVTLADAGADAVFGWDDSANAYENLTAAEVLAVIEATTPLLTEAEAAVSYQANVFLNTPPADDRVPVGDSAVSSTWRAVPDSDGATQKLQYDTATNSFSAGTDDDVPESGDFTALTGGSGIDNNSGTLDFDATELNDLTWGDGSQATIAWTYNVSTGTDPVLTFGDASLSVKGVLQPEADNTRDLGSTGATWATAHINSIELANGTSNTLTASGGVLAIEGTAIVNSTRSIVSGAGLTGGGDLSADRTLAVGAGTCVTVNADDVAVTADCIGPTQVDETANYAWSGDSTVTGSLTFDADAIHILDTNASHDLILTPGSDLTADRVLTIATGDAARTITLAGNLAFEDNNLDQFLFFDDSAGTVTNATLARLSTEATPTTGDYVILIGAEGDYRKVNWSELPGAAGGVNNFLDLTDTPESYTGEAGKCVTVNGTEDALEFTECASGGGGGGDSIRVEDDDNAGTFTAATNPDFEDSGDINFVLNAAATPDEISAQIRADAVGDAELNGADNFDITGSMTFDSDALQIDDTNASHQLIITPGSDLTADRVLTLTTGDSARTITLSGNPTLADWFDQSVKTTAAPTFDDLTTTDDVLVGDDLSVGGAVVIADAAGTATLQNIDALDATTESTIEAAIDTLANLTSVQGRTVTLADAGADAVFGWDDSADAYENLTGAEVAAAIGDNIALTTNTTGNYVKDVADGTGIDGTAAGEGATYTPTLDLTEITSMTWGNGNFTTETYSGAGAIDLTWTYSTSATATLSHNDAGAQGPILNLFHDTASPADGDTTDIRFTGGADDEVIGSIKLETDDGATTTEDTRFRFTVRTAGSDEEVITAVGGNVTSSGDFTSTDDLISGDDVLLSSAGVLNFDSGDCTLTDGTNVLTMDGCDLVTEVLTPDGDNTRDFGSAAATWATAHINSIELANGTANTLTASGGTLAIEGVNILTTATGQPLDTDLTTLSTAFATASASGAATLDFAEDTDNGSNRVRLAGAASTADVTVTLPAATGTLVLDSRAINSGNGLTGGGDLSADRTLAVGAGTCITSNADDVAVTADCIGPTQVDETATFSFTGTVEFDSDALQIDDTNASHQLIITPGSDLTADRVFTLTTGDAARTLTISANATLNDADYGDITTSSSFTSWQIDSGAVGSAEIADGSVAEADVDIANAASDESCLTYESDTSNFAWQSCSAGAGDQLGSDADRGDITISGGSGTVADVDPAITVDSTADAVDGIVWTFEHSDPTPDAGDDPFEIVINAGDDQEKIAGLQVELVDDATTTEDVYWLFTADIAGTLTDILRIGSGGVLPGADNTLDLGSAANTWANLHVTTIELANGTANTLTASGGVLSVEGVAQVATTRTLTGGTGIAAIGDLSADRTITWDPTETNSNTFGSGTYTTLTFDAGATDPVITAGSNTLGFTGLTTFKVGTTTSSTVSEYAGGTLTPILQAAATDSSAATGIVRSSADASPPHIVLQKTRDAIGTFTTALTDGDGLGAVVFSGVDDSVEPGAVILGEVDGTPFSASDASDMPGRIAFLTTTDGSATPAVRMTIKASSEILIGDNQTVQSIWHDGTNSALLQINGTGSNSSAGISRWSNSASDPRFSFAKSRGAAVGTNGIVSSGDTLGTINWLGDDTNSFAKAAQITAVVDGTPSDGTDMPGRLEFSTAADGTAGGTVRLALKADGGVILGNGNTSPGAEDLSIEGGDIEFGNAGTAGTDTTLSYAAAGEVTLESKRITMNCGSSVATTSGDDISLSSSIPANTKVLYISFNGVSISGTDDINVVIGDSGGAETTGYTSFGGSNTTIVAGTAGFLINTTAASEVLYGNMELFSRDTTTWSESHTMVADDATDLLKVGAGNKATSATTDRVQLSTSGSNTFDAGSARVCWDS